MYLSKINTIFAKKTSHVGNLISIGIKLVTSKHVNLLKCIFEKSLSEPSLIFFFRNFGKLGLEISFGIRTWIVGSEANHLTKSTNSRS